MAKPADMLRAPAMVFYEYRVDYGDLLHNAAALFEECDRVIQQYVNDLEFGVAADSKPRRIEYARATLAKLRGEQ